ncbi:kinase-like domain-containing protein [Phyllosticta citricarpa]
MAHNSVANNESLLVHLAFPDHTHLTRTHPETRIFLEGHGCRVERRPGNLVVKYGTSVTNAERFALAHANTLNIPVPRLHDDLPAPATDNNGQPTNLGSEGVAIWMDYVPGDLLEDVWPTMTDAQKMDIAMQLRAILDEMRRQTSPTGVIAACDGGKLTDRRTYIPEEGGPFADEAAFNDFQIDGLFKPTPGFMRDALTQAVQSRWTQHRVVFTHCDLTQHNIIIDKESNRIRALIDWEYAGWFPEHWEYLKFIDMMPKNRDWRDYMPYIFSEQYVDDLIVFQALKRWQKP